MDTDEEEAARPDPPAVPDDGPASGPADAPGPATGGPEEPATPEVGSGLVRSSTVVAVGTLLSRVTGLVRTVLTLTVLGAVGIGTAYNVANNTPNMLYDLLLGGVLSATLVPALVANREHHDDDGTAAVLSVCTVVLLVVTVIGILAAPVIVGGYAALAQRTRPLSEDQQTLAVLWLRMFAPQILFYGLTTLGSAYLNAHRRFAAAAFAPVANNVWMIALLLAMRQSLNGQSPGSLLDDPMMVGLLGLGTTAGIVAMTLVLLPAIQRAGLPLRWHFDIGNASVRQVARLSGWTFGYVVANQVTMFVITGLAGDGGVSYWNVAYQFFQVPYGVFTVSIMTAFTPELSALAGRRSMDEYRARFLQGFRLVVITVLPATVAFVFLARPLVVALLEHGNFKTSDVSPTASTLVALAWGLIGFAIYLYVLRAFYTFRDTRTPFLINVVENILTIALALLLATESGFGWGVEGLAWAWSIAYLVSAAGAFVVLRVRLGSFGFETTVATTATVIRMVTAAVAMAAGVLLVTTLLPDSVGDWAALLIGGTVGLAVYAGVLLLLGVSEVRYLPRMLVRRS